MKILFLTLNPNLQGPLPKHNPLLIEALENLGCQITRSTWGRHSENENILQKIFGRLEDVGKILVELVRMKPDIMYVATAFDEHALVRDVFLLLSTHWSPVKKVLKIHGSKTVLLVKPGHCFYKFLARILIQLSDAILLLSNEELNIWRQFNSRGKYFQVANPFIPNLGKFKNQIIERKKQNIILFVGRLIKEKGIYELIDAMKDIVNKVDCQLLIVGEGEEKKEILNIINDAHLENSITLMGYLENEKLYQAYRMADVFILPTYREGFSTSIAEAMSYGLPIVTTLVGGTPDHLLEGVNALFIQPRNPAAITNAVLRLLNDKKLCFEMKKANLNKVQEFRPENVVTRYIQTFQELLGRDMLLK